MEVCGYSAIAGIPSSDFRMRNFHCHAILVGYQSASLCSSYRKSRSDHKSIFEVITIFKYFLKYNSDLPLSFDKFIYNVYYFPYLWIISVYICNFTKIQTWIQNQKKRTSVTVVVPEYRVVVRPQRIDETMISELSVSELETVM
ncbi:hypothetical protein GCK72_011499 [Caenorhabditis remanei]|uniref:Uncharacterized protein n=1 Tax=Caenorhabditis remanei TaxID=31234 RepID=A0A6A5H9Y7_CAERE|nr:hypothetical protein GCK72_011499 [Caenorhabditis remanei]KAF1763233.1 hypothetical protein GCK72_011499 [Caenorhabditis remanei]